MAAADTADPYQATPTDMADIWRWLRRILAPEREFLIGAIIFGIAISLLTLAIPVSVQMLVDSVAQTALLQPVIVLSASLLVLLLLSGGLWASRHYLMEIFARRIHARLSAELALTAIHARTPWFEEARRSDLYNRYFDIMTVQKAVPNIMIDGFSVVFQAAISFLIVSFYHPLLFLYVLGILVLLGLVWILWGRRATLEQVAVSHEKYRTAHWLESLAATNGFYKYRRHVAHALERTEAHCADYLAAQKRQFGAAFPQILALLAIYAIASAILLGMGGWLVIRGEMTLGQLVAAELMMTSALFGLSTFGIYLEKFYLLAAAVAELSLILDAPLEPASGVKMLPEGSCDLEFHDVRAGNGDGSLRLSLAIPAGTKAVIAAADAKSQRLFTNLLKRHAEPVSGHITLAGEDLQALDVRLLRQRIIVLDRPAIVECTIADYLRLARPEAIKSEIWAALELVGLGERVRALPAGDGTPLLSSGWPLSMSETLRLKLAAALLSEPDILVLGEDFDVMPPAVADAIHRHLASLDAMTVLLFTHREPKTGFELRIKLESAAAAASGATGTGDVA